ncbi:YukJ family protein [Bacillus cereus]|uniref:YukJ family protein n=1 Tax=Bacillus cereus TaxID=1396 RepID=UPI0018F3C26E|nr:YukJ family protein [Bacillus cereus]MBJ7934888.1 YukJ family protein [Bacillus cereus]
MPVERYGVLKGIVVDSKEERDDDKPHYQIHIEGEEGVHYRVAVNVMSSSPQSEVLYLADDNFNAEAITILPTMDNGYIPINNDNQEIALDYIRSNLFDPTLMRALPHDESGPDNDLNDFMHKYIKKAKVEQAMVYVYGSRFDPEDQEEEDHVFDFGPTDGMHNVHMNQGNDKDGRWGRDNGVFHDGGILIQFENNWVAIFLAFLSQSWCTNDDGHPTEQCTHLDGQR